jgi:hypothetical protein
MLWINLVKISKNIIHRFDVVVLTILAIDTPVLYFVGIEMSY